MLKGITVKPLKMFADERGFFTELYRSDWKEIVDEAVQANLSISYPDTIRAWHRHEKGQVDYFVAIKGAIKICAYDEAAEELDEIISTGNNPQVVRIPGHYWHGFQVLGNEPAILIYFVNKLYDYNDPDEVRRLWNDPISTPKKINGRSDDPRCGEPWDWQAPPHK